MRDEALSWDSVIEDVPREEYKQLEDGCYQFVVASLEQAKWGQDVKYVGGFPYAKITLAIMQEGEQIGQVIYNLTLSKSNQWRIREFFAAIGVPVEDGKGFAPKWNKATGKKGTVELKKDQFQGRDGNIIKSNKVVKFVKSEPVAETKEDDDDFDF